MRGHLAALAVAQLVGEALCQRTDAGFADVVGRISRRVGNPLFGSRIHDGTGRLLAGHLLTECLQPVDDAPEVYAHDLMPLVDARQRRRAAPAGARVVHQEVNLAKTVQHGVSKRFDRIGI